MTLSLSGAKTGLVFVANHDVDIQITFLDAAGDPLDISAMTWTAEILDGPGGTLLAAFTVTPGSSLIDLSMAKAVTAVLPRRSVWVLTETATAVTPWLSGPVTVTAAGATTSIVDTAAVTTTPFAVDVVDGVIQVTRTDL